MKYKAYLKIIVIQFVKSFNYKLNYFISILMFFVPILIQYFIWSSININLGDYKNIDDIVLYYALVYFILGFIHTRTASNINTDFKTGNLILKKILPVNYGLYNFFGAVGNSFFQLLFISFPLMLIIIILFIRNITMFSFIYINITLFFFSLIIGFCINFLIMYLIGIISFKFKENFGFVQLNYFLNILFSGMLIPFDFLPNWMMNVSNILPYKYIIYSPIKMLMSNSVLKDKLFIIFIQLLFVVIGLSVVLILSKKWKYSDIYGG